jgi:hypothetical protein
LNLHIGSASQNGTSQSPSEENSMNTRQQDLFSDEPVKLDRVKRELRTSDILGSIIAKQQFWARRNGIPLQGSQGERGTKAYTLSLEQNLFEALLPSVEAQLRAGNGQELGSPGRVGKALALHSSATLCINTFHHWLRIGRLDLVHPGKVAIP